MKRFVQNLSVVAFCATGVATCTSGSMRQSRMFDNQLRFATNTPTTPSSYMDEEELDEELKKLHIITPRDAMSPEDQERHRKTQVFLDRIMAVAQDQDALDMLHAAMSLKTLKRHHVDTILRMMRRDRDAVDPLLGKGAVGTSTTIDGKRRALLLLKEATMELVPLPGVAGSSQGDAVAPSLSSSGASVVTEEHWNKLLMTLLTTTESAMEEDIVVKEQQEAQKEQQGEDDGDGSSVELSPSVIAMASTIWDATATMELHGFNITGPKTLAILEALVTVDTPAQPRDGKSGKLEQVAKLNRLEFLAHQRALLLKQTTTHFGKRGGVRPAVAPASSV